MKTKQILSFLTLFAATTAFATGVSKPVQVGPKAMGMGGAFVGVADDPTAIYHNPAAIAFLKGNQLEVGMDALITDEHYTPPVGAKENADTEFLPVPQFGFTSNHFHPVSLGLGVFFPHGNGGTFSKFKPSGVISNPDEGRIYSMEISPAMAVQLTDTISVGGSIRMIRVSSVLKGQFFPTPLGNLMLEELDVSGWGVAGAVGGFWRPCDSFSMGMNWRSQAKIGVSGKSTFTSLGTLDTSYDQVLPSMLTVGLSGQPFIENLRLAASYDFERNSELKGYDVTLKGLGTLPLAQNWKNSHTIHFGGEYKVTPAVAVRAGYAKDLNDSIPNAAMNRIIGDIAAHEVSGGLAYKWQRYTIAGTWNARYGTRTIPATGADAGIAPGKYQAFVQSISLGVTAEL